MPKEWWPVSMRDTYQYQYQVIIILVILHLPARLLYREPSKTSRLDARHSYMLELGLTPKIFHSKNCWSRLWRAPDGTGCKSTTGVTIGRLSGTQKCLHSLIQVQERGPGTIHQSPSAEKVAYCTYPSMQWYRHNHSRCIIEASVSKPEVRWSVVAGGEVIV